MFRDENRVKIFSIKKNDSTETKYQETNIGHYSQRKFSEQ